MKELFYEIAEKIVESNYGLEVTYDDKSIILHKQPINGSTVTGSIIEQS